MTKFNDFAQNRLGRLDSNLDGMINPEELTALREQLQGAGFTPFGGQRPNFGQFDTDGDGMLSDAERMAIRDRRQANGLPMPARMSGIRPMAGMNGMQQNGSLGAAAMGRLQSMGAMRMRGGGGFRGARAR